MSAFLPSLVVAVLGLATTVLLTWLYYNTQIGRAREQFAAWCEERQQIITRTIDGHVEALYGLRALFDSSEYVSPQEFARYTSNAITRHRDVLSFGYLRTVTHAQRDAFEAQYTSVLGRPFRIVEWHDGQTVPAPPRERYAPLVYAQTRDAIPVGLDSLTVQSVAEAMRTTAATDEASVAFTTMDDAASGESRRIAHVYLAIFSQPTRDASLEHREIDGYVRMRFVIDSVADKIQQQAREAGIAMALLEPGADSALSDTGDGEIVSRMHWNGAPQLEWRGGIVVADKKLSMQMRATPEYAGMRLPIPVWALLLAGGMGTLLGTLSTYSLTRSRLRNERMSRNLAAEMHERRLSEQRTAQSEARYRSLIEHSPDAMLLIRDDRVTFVNREMANLMRASAQQDLIGRSALDLVHPEFRDVARQRMESMSRDRTMLPPLESRLLRLDGSTVDVEVRSMPFVSDGETVIQVTIRDITARRNAERERLSLEAALRQSQRLEAIGTLTGGIAHDFNNILSSVVGNIQIVLEDLPSGHPARQSAHEIRNATNRARDLVKRLMAFGRQQEAPQTPLELDGLIDEVQQLLRPALPSGVVIHSHVPPDTPPVVGDATQLHQVLLNLCTNAWQAMPAGRGEIRINVSTLTAEEARREARTDLQGASFYVRIEVQDNGSGIPAGVIDRIFDPFFTTKPAGEGSGLGLAVVHGIVHSHQGAIVARSELGIGTTFVVYLRASERPASPAFSPLARRSHGANEHVLYIDDEEPLVVLVSRILERNGYRCSATTDPREAIAWVKRDPQAFDLVLTDMNMPGMTGIEVAREILAHRPSLPVVITTGYVRASDVAATQTLGIRDLILKPDTIDELANLVARYLHGSAPSTA